MNSQVAELYRVTGFAAALSNGAVGICIECSAAPNSFSGNDWTEAEMLYDPKWGKKAKANLFTLKNLIAWLEAKDPKQTYDWRRGAACACAQYFAAGDNWCRQCDRLSKATGIDLDILASEQPWTFGALLDRVRAATG